MRIKNWERFQHYKTRKPPWIKLYRELLDDRHFCDLSGDASKMLVMCWLLASEDDGELPSVENMAWRLRERPDKVRRLIDELNHWVVGDASTMLANGKHDAMLEKELEREKESERETRAREEFVSMFWPTYPHKVGKERAEKAFLTARKKTGLTEIMDGLTNYVSNKPPDRSWLNPATFLHQKRWLDEPANPTSEKKAWEKVFDE